MVEELDRVWFPTEDEQKAYLERFSKPLVLDKRITDIILKHYHEEVDNIQTITLDTCCPTCKTELKYKDGWDFFACPNWKRDGTGCVGFILNRRDYELRKKTNVKGIIDPQRDMFNGIGWVDRTEIELKKEDLCITRNLIYRFLKENGLSSPATIKEWMGGVGVNNFKKGKERSEEQEKKVFDLLKYEYGGDGIVEYHRWIFFTTKNESNNIKHRIPDFLVYDGNKIIIFECKLHEYQFERQRDEYSELIKKMFPDKEVVFKLIPNEHWIRNEDGTSKFEYVDPYEIITGRKRESLSRFF